MDYNKTNLWPVRYAKELTYLKRPIKLEMGIGASGIPHVGSIGDAIRSNFIRRVLEDMGVQTKLIAFSDDMDGLRKVPIGFPEKYKKLLGQSVSRIPDPFSCCSSYSEHMSNLLKEALEKCGIIYEFRSSTENYNRGNFNEQIRKIIKAGEKVKKIIFEETASQKEEGWIPFYVRCANCDNLYTTRIIEIDSNSDQLSYVCDGTFKEREGCGHKAETTYLDGHGKLPWKSDWAARWAAFDIDFECYGKDLIEAFNANNRVLTEILGDKRVGGMMYELFTDKGGNKISKSRGDVFTPQRWLEYASRESLLFLMLKNPESSKEVSEGVIPRYESEISKLEMKLMNQGIEKLSPNEELTLRLLSPDYSIFRGLPLPDLYDNVITLMGELGIREKELIKTYLPKLNPEFKNWLTNPSFEDRLQKAMNYFEKVKITKEKSFQVSLKTPVKVLEELCQFLEQNPEGEIIQNKVFELAKTHGLDIKGVFQDLYHIMIDNNHGPRLGNLLETFGPLESTKRIRKAIVQHG